MKLFSVTWIPDIKEGEATVHRGAIVCAKNSETAEAVVRRLANEAGKVVVTRSTYCEEAVIKAKEIEPLEVASGFRIGERVDTSMLNQSLLMGGFYDEAYITDLMVCGTTICAELEAAEGQKEVMSVGFLKKVE